MLITLILLANVVLIRGYISNVPSDVVYDNGDLNLAILLGHRAPACHSDASYFIHGTRYLHGLIWNIEKVNADPNILPNHKLGYIAYDTCLGNRGITQAQTIRFMPNPQQLFTNGSGEYAPKINLSAVDIADKIYQEVVGVIGPHTSSEAQAMADLVDMYRLPTVSSTSTSMAVSGHEYLYRVVPVDNIQADTVVEFIHAMNWTYVSIIYVEDSYGTPLARVIKNGLQSYGVCIPVLQAVYPEDGILGMELVVKKLIANKAANVIVPIIYDKFRNMLIDLLHKNGHANTFTIVG